jgi:hypothetical protein
LANEDVLQPGKYPARFRICGPTGIVWEHETSVQIPSVQLGGDGPLSVPVLREHVLLNGPPGIYEFVANLDKGGAPAGRGLHFFVSDAARLPETKHSVTLWGIDPNVEAWLKSRGFDTQQFSPISPARREIILVGDLSRNGSDPNSWKELIRRMAQGSVIVFLSPEAFRHGEDPVAWLPISPKSRYFRFDDVSIYHKECVAKEHPVFEGLQTNGIMNWDYYGPLIPHYAFDGLATPDDVAAVGFAVGFYGAYASGVLLGAYRCSVRNDSFTPMGNGIFVVNTFPVLENVDSHPAADRLLLNLINYAARFTDKPIASIPDDFDAQLKKIGYISTRQRDKVMGAAGPDHSDHD